MFVRELFLQCLPANVCMVLASTRDNTPIDGLAQLAEKVMKVIIPTMSKLAVQPSTHDFELLQGEITSLGQEIKMLQQAAHNQVPHRRSPSPHRCHSSTLCWYHQSLELQLRNADHPVLTRKRPTHPLMATSVAGHHPCRLFMSMTVQVVCVSWWTLELRSGLFHLHLLTITTTRLLPSISRLSITHQ